MNICNTIIDFITAHEWLDGKPSCSFLAAGEYNENYLITTGNKRFVFRINHGTQLNLENQIEYEFNVLTALKQSGVTPKPYYYAMGCEGLGDGVLMMDYIEGRPLDYRKDLDKAAHIFARIHAVPVSEKLIVQDSPLVDICQESKGLLERYPIRHYADVHRLLMNYHDALLDEAEHGDQLFSDEQLCIVNTEVNSGNFIISDERSCLVDWEKAVVSCRYQDLGHFLVPTTTLWKADIRLNEHEKKEFLSLYKEKLGLDIELSTLLERTVFLEKIILLRALSWCYMAYHEYSDDSRSLQHSGTFSTITSYLDEAECFLK